MTALLLSPAASSQVQARDEIKGRRRPLTKHFTRTAGNLEKALELSQSRVKKTSEETFKAQGDHQRSPSACGAAPTGLGSGTPAGRPHTFRKANRASSEWRAKGRGRRRQSFQDRVRRAGNREGGHVWHWETPTQAASRELGNPREAKWRAGARRQKASTCRPAAWPC